MLLTARSHSLQDTMILHHKDLLDKHKSREPVPLIHSHRELSNAVTELSKMGAESISITTILCNAKRLEYHKQLTKEGRKLLKKEQMNKKTRYEAEKKRSIQYTIK